MRSRTTLFAILFAVISFSLPLVAQAGIPFFGPIIPETNSSCAAGWGMVMIVINNIISFVITIAIVFVAPIMIAYAGFLFVVNPVNAGGKEKARSILLHTIVGIIIALSGWLIVDMVMSALYSAPSGWGSWSNIINSGDDPCLLEVGAIIITPPSTPSPPPSSPPTSPGNEQTVRQKLAQAGVTINNSACSTGSSGQGCTNVAGMKSATISQIINIANSCPGCSIVVTGGSEPGHASGTYSHGNGYKVDFRTGSGIDSLLSSMTRAGTRTGSEPGPIYKDTCGNEYVRASDHWDITILQACSKLILKNNISKFA